jgi:hypothetical protein
VIRRAAIAVGLGAAAVLCALRPAAARADEPSSGDLVLAGLAMAPPTYVLGVAAHEGSHALAALLVGADVEQICLLPGRDPATGAFYFGRTRVRGLGGGGDRTFFLLAPKLTDLIVLGGYTALLATDTLPDNRYGQLAFVVVGTGFWVDFSKDVLRFSRFNDVVKIYNQHGWTSEWSRLPWRLAHAAIGATFGVVLYHGYRRVFDPDDDGTESRTGFVLPLVGGSF